MSRVRDFAQYAALRGIYGFLHTFPINANLHTADVVGSVFFNWSTRHRERAITHLRAAYPEWPDAEVRRIAERSVRHMIRMFMVETIQTPRLIHPGSWHRHVEVPDGDPKFQRALQILLEGRPAIFVTGHSGNWELLGFALSLLGFPMTALARPVDNPYLDKWIVGVREARGLSILSKFGASDAAVDVLRQGGRLAFIADQDAGRDGVFVPFFGRFASVYKSIALLAMTQEVPIIVGGAFRVGDGFRYRLEVSDVIEPKDWANDEDPLFAITARFTHGIEMGVRGAPDQYLWIHRRWKSRPKHELEGKPVPPRIESRLRALPWMSEVGANEFIDRSNVLANGSATHV
ncbi:MAG: lipid A biosynthesis acyltransferase [Planctomycetota bacterium]|nr:lipid A biosynthesis acyltransferase [Planctomycetota bacterium]